MQFSVSWPFKIVSSRLGRSNVLVDQSKSDDVFQRGDSTGVWRGRGLQHSLAIGVWGVSVLPAGGWPVGAESDQQFGESGQCAERAG